MSRACFLPASLWESYKKVNGNFRNFENVSLFHTLVFSGDEIFSVNGRSLSGLTHHEAISIFKEIKVGSVQVTMGRREVKKKLVKMEAENF